MVGSLPRASWRSATTTTVRSVTRGLWALVFLAEALLCARIVAVLTWGINGDLSSPAKAPAFVYAATAPLVNDLASSANFLVPYRGLKHAFDIAALLAMVIIFFGALALTKLANWIAGCCAGRPSS